MQGLPTCDVLAEYLSVLNVIRTNLCVSWWCGVTPAAVVCLYRR